MTIETILGILAMEVSSTSAIEQSENTLEGHWFQVLESCYKYRVCFSFDGG